MEQGSATWRKEVTSKFLQVKEKSNNGQQVKLGIPPDQDSDSLKENNSKATSDIATDNNPEAGRRQLKEKPTSITNLWKKENFCLTSY